MKKFYQLHNKSLSKHKVENLKELWDKLKSKGYKGIAVQVKTEFKKSSKEENRYHAIFSTASVDRHGDIVEQKWDLKSFKSNPVYLDSHNYNSIEHIIGKIEKIKVKDNKLIGDIVFALSNPKGQMASEMANDGFLSASSVGFIPLEFDQKFERILKSELLEISAVSVPANPEALYEKKYDTSKKERKENKEGNNGDNNKGEDKGENDGGNEEGEEGNEEETKSISSSERIKNAIRKEIEIREKAINKVLTAIKFIEASTKGRDSAKNNEAIKNKLNRAVKALLEIKKN